MNINELTSKLKDVARHSVDGYGRQDISYNDPEGEFVFYSDYEALAEALEAAEKVSAARLEAIDRAHKMFQRERDRAEAAEKRYENRTPTEWAYGQACAAIENHRTRADTAEARIAELEARTLTVTLPLMLDSSPHFNGGVKSAFKNFEMACAGAGIKLQIEGE